MAALQAAILSSVHDVGDARIHRHVAALIRDGFDVEVWGTGDAARGPAGAVVHALPRRGLVRRTLRAARLPWRTRAGYLISVDPDVAIACGVRTRLGGRIHVADVHEDYEALLRDRGWARGLAWLPARFIAVLGRRAAERADLTAVADDHLVTRARERVVVRNVPELPDATALDDAPRAVYVGDVRASRGLFAMLDAVDDAPGWTLDIVGPVAPADEEACDVRAAQLGERVRVHGRLEPHKAWSLAAGAWAGFVLLDATPAFERATASKLYEYLAHGIPAIASPLPTHIALMDESGAGVIVRDASEAAATMRAWAEQPKVVQDLSTRARAWARGSATFSQGSGVLARSMRSLDAAHHLP